MARILGIDYGSKRVGLAITDAGQIIASPFKTVTSHNLELQISELSRIVEEEDVCQIVIGLPIGLKGNYTTQTKKTEQFADVIRKKIGLPVTFYDERLTSVQAKRILISEGKKPSREKDLVDKTAAAIMLQAFLDSR